MKHVELSACTHSSLAWMCSGLKGWDKRLIISDRAHIGKSSWCPLEVISVRCGSGSLCYIPRTVHEGQCATSANTAPSEVSVRVSSLPPPQCLTSIKRLMGFRNSRGRSKQEKSKNRFDDSRGTHVHICTSNHSSRTDRGAFEKCGTWKSTLLWCRTVH